MPKDPIKTLELIEKGLEEKVRKIIDGIAFKIKRRVDSQEFIKWKSKRKPIVVEKARLVGNLMKVTVRGASRWTWGHVLIGPPGSTTITAKRGMLAIPTDAAQKGGGRGQPGPKSYSGTWVGGGFIWGKAGWGGVGTGGYLRQHRAAGEKFSKEKPIPLFTLRKSVVVRRRVIPAELNKWGNQLLREALIKGKLLKP